MERGRRSWSSQQLATTNGFTYAAFDRSSGVESMATIPVASSHSLPTSSSPSSPSEGVNYIEHRVTMKDTLAGVAIKYGVEVADIRRLNGLAMDLQMFARKFLWIPRPGRHPPSSSLKDDSVNNREQTPPHRPHIDILDSLESRKLKPPWHKVSPAMSLLHGYYGLTPPQRGKILQGPETAVYRTGKSLFLDDESLFREPSNSEPPPNRHRKYENDEITESDAERSIRRRQKSDVLPEPSLREENSGGFSGRMAKGLALRPKSGSRADMNKSQQNLVLVGESSSLADGLHAVRKSSSTPDLQDSDGGSVRPTSKWNLRPDSFALPIFDGLPKPASWRNKAARD